MLRLDLPALFVLLELETGHNNIRKQVAEVQAWLQAFLKTATAGN